MAIRVPLQRWRGARGLSQGPAVRRGCCPASRAAAWLAAGAGCAGCWHKPPPADGALPCGCVQKHTTLGQLPAFGGWSFDRYFQVPALRPWAGIEPATTPFGGLYQTELPVVGKPGVEPGMSSCEASPRPCRYPAFAVCGMQGIDMALRARIPCTGGANVGPNPGL